MANYWDSTVFSMQYATQTDFDAPEGSPSWVAFEVEGVPQWTPAREIQRRDITSAKAFARFAHRVGGEFGGTLKFRMGLSSQVTTYDPTSDTPAANAAAYFLTQLMGASAAGSVGETLDAVSPGDANTWETAGSGLNPGQAYAIGTGGGAGTGDVRAIGYVATVSSTTNELFEDTIAAPVASDEVYPFRNIYGDLSTQPTPLTMRITGVSTDHDVWCVGWIPTMATIEFGGLQPMVEFEGIISGTLFKTGQGDGGLTTATAYQYMPPVIGEHQARVWLRGSDNSDGSADVDGTCGWSDLKVTIRRNMLAVRGAGEQGVCDVVLGRGSVDVEVNVPLISDYVSSNKTTWDNYLINGTQFSLTGHVGKVAGSLFAFRLPALFMDSPATFTDVGGIRHLGLKMSAGDYTADGASTNGGDSAATFSFG